VALRVLQTGTLDRGAISLHLVVDDADRGPVPPGEDESDLADARLVAIRVVNGQDRDVAVRLTDAQGREVRDQRGSGQRVGAPGDRTFSLPGQTARRMELRDIRHLGFGGAA